MVNETHTNSYTGPRLHDCDELYDDEVRILAAAIKIRHIGKFSARESDIIVSTHARRAT